MFSLRFDFRDIFKANRIAFSLQRIWIQFLGVTVGYLGYLVFTYASLITAGNNFSVIWRHWGLLPCLGGTDAQWYSRLLFAIGVIFFLVINLIASTAVSRATYMLLKGNNFYTWKEAFAFALRKSSSIIMSPVAIAILILLFIIGGLFVGLLGKIPFVGELGFSLFYFVWFLAGFFIVFFIIVFCTSLLLSPSIIATTDDDAFEAVFQSFSIFWNQPWRFIIYEVIVGFLTVAGFVVLAFLAKKAFLVTNAIFLAAMGDKYINLMGHGMYLLSGWVSASIDWINTLFGEYATLFYFSHEFLQLKLPVVLNIAAYIFALMMLVIGAWVVSYSLATFNAGQTLIYLVLRKIKDKDNLLERKDKEEEEEELEEEKQMTTPDGEHKKDTEDMSGDNN